MYSSSNFPNSKTIGQSTGCPIQIGNNICGETNSLDILKEFNEFYQNKMEQIDCHAGGDCLHEKIKLQQEWIKNLTQQNEMLAKAVQELEYEAAERVQILESKLQQSAQCLCEVMKNCRENNMSPDVLPEPSEVLSEKDNDIKNMLEFVRRIRENDEWNLDGLFFYNIEKEDLIGIGDYGNCKQLMSLHVKKEEKEEEGEEMLCEKQKTIEELQQKVNQYNSYEDIDRLTNELKSKREECESLKENMANMQAAFINETRLHCKNEIAILKRDIDRIQKKYRDADMDNGMKNILISQLKNEVAELKQISEKYCVLIKQQINTSIIEAQKTNSYQKNDTETEVNVPYSEITELKQMINTRDNLLLEQLNLIKIFVIKLFTIDQHLKYLEEKLLSISSATIARDMESLKEQNESLINENDTLKNAVSCERKHIEQLEDQFKSFFMTRDNLKRENKILEKKLRHSLRDRETVSCNCDQLSLDLRKLKAENESLLTSADSLKKQLGMEKEKSADHRAYVNEIMAENQKYIDQLLTQKQENTKLIHVVDELKKHKSNEATVNFTQQEICKLSSTIGELTDKLKRTKIAQDEQQKDHVNKLDKLNYVIRNQENELKSLREKLDKDNKICKICRGRSKVGFLETTEVQTNLEPELLEELNQIKTIMRIQIKQKDEEICTLKCKVNELESVLNSCEERASNLQEAVALYSDSVNVLEAAGEHANKEIDDQKITIANLQDALVKAKQEIDELHVKSVDNDLKYQEAVGNMKTALNHVEEKSFILQRDYDVLTREHERLEDLNFLLELDHYESLQDIELLENQLNKYKYLYKEAENELNETKDLMKKIAKQKQCYEEIINYFKKEMGIMAEQLNSLQELLTLSNESANQETAKIMEAFMEVQTLNEKLSSQLCACEQKVQLENQMNQLHETKIDELQQLLVEKEMDLSRHDQAILSIRKTLNDSIKQNEELQKTIFNLNETINDLQLSVRNYEQDNCANKESATKFQEQIENYYSKLEELKTNLDGKTTECIKLEMAYNNEKRALKAAQKQLQETENIQLQNQQHLIDSLMEVKEELAKSYENYSNISDEYGVLQNQLTNLSRKDAAKDLEIQRYRKIVGDLKNTMMELNSELNKNFSQKLLLKSECKNSSCQCSKEETLNSSPPQDFCLNCPCEVEFYQKMVDMLKKSIKDLRRKLNETQHENKQFGEELERKKTLITEYERSIKELNQKLKELQTNDTKAIELEKELEQLRQDLRDRAFELNSVKRNPQELNGSKCKQLSCAHEEIVNLKVEISNILSRQCKLNQENEQLQNQIAQLQYTIDGLNDKNRVLIEQIENCYKKCKNFNAEKENLIHRNKQLMDELKALDALSYSMNKKQRFAKYAKKQLKNDLKDLHIGTSDMCFESQQMMKIVKAWVEEQNKINYHINNNKKPPQSLKFTKKMISQKEIPLTNYNRTSSQRMHVSTSRPNFQQMTGNNFVCSSPYSLGSQGVLFYENEEFVNSLEPGTSPYVTSNDWYSPASFKTESDNESEEEYCVNKLENLTQQMRKSNRLWNEKKMCQSCSGPSRKLL